MKIARTIVGSCLALSLTIPFTASASAASQSEHPNAPHVSPVANPLEGKLSQTADQNVKAAGVDAGLNVNVDVLGISDRIAEAVKSDQNRTGWVKNVMETTFYASGQKYNVMVFNLNQEYEDRFNGVQFYGSAVYDGITYGIWVFEDGSFDNKGDGGWINWAFRGWFDRDNQHIEFHRP
ncbi:MULTISPECIES: stress protein [Bacillus]|uniref:Stress protein n=1 Tax=Bacillus velezensis TaxID=492670 RepID=A0A6A8LBT1_BACVE|nr:stress protein [Bacillus velezensis]MED2911853.1 stress protein [Bacillus velezensis]MSD96692.1 stress protein [Bacillus velezensis]MSE01375.1 stress protein [Bacillus velezensis]MSE11546.1 stress protein [Bacillus velezensis]QHM89111.1 Stress response protein YvgO [Bacillus velezensis]